MKDKTCAPLPNGQCGGSSCVFDFTSQTRLPFHTDSFLRDGSIKHIVQSFALNEQLKSKDRC